MTGLRFECQPGCTNCCRQKGFVYITEADLTRMAKYINMRPAGSNARYVYRTRHLLRLRMPRHSQCHFLREEGCSHHPPSLRSAVSFPFGRNWWIPSASGARPPATARASAKGN